MLPTGNESLDLEKNLRSLLLFFSPNIFIEKKQPSFQTQQLWNEKSALGKFYICIVFSTEATILILILSARLHLEIQKAFQSINYPSTPGSGRLQFFNITVFLKSYNSKVLSYIIYAPVLVVLQPNHSPLSSSGSRPLVSSVFHINLLSLNNQ